jgi:heat shock protein HslJ
MAGPPEAMALEKMFLDRLQTVSSFKPDGDLLHLYTLENQTVTFERVYN